METFKEFRWGYETEGHHMAYLTPALDQGLLGHSGRLLDIGSGNGWQAARLSRTGDWQCVGVDPSSSGVAIAREKAGGIARFENLGASADLLEQLQEEPFDAVISMEVVEHVFDTWEWARAAFNALKPGGRLVASTPYHGRLKLLALALAPGNKIDFHFQPRTTGGHIKFFTMAGWRQLLEEVGFEQVKISGAGRGPWLWKSMVATAIKPRGRL